MVDWPWSCQVAKGRCRTNKRNSIFKRKLLKQPFQKIQEFPIIPPLLVDNNLISNFRDIFNDFLVHQCQPIATNSILPTNQIFYTQNRLRNFDINCGKISKLINGLYSHKSHGHDGISMQMAKLCNLTITKSLLIIYKNGLQQIAFPD